jgi:sulfite exporter TauE/SafE
MLLDLVAPLAIGFFGSLHCLGMCGPLVVAYSIRLRSAGPGVSQCCGSVAAIEPWRSGMLHHAAFHLGRLLCYGILGSLAAGLFSAADLSRLFFNVRVNMHLVGGTLLVICGVLLMRIIPLPAAFTNVATMPASILGRTVGRLIASRGAASKVALGFTVGFLPCCLSWAMLLTAASTMHFGRGFLTMVAFGIGTLPALAFAGLICSVVTARMRIMGESVAGIFVALMGLLLIMRGIGIVS